MLIIGSYSLHLQGKSNKPFPNDLDIIGTLTEYNAFCKFFQSIIVSAMPLNAKKFHIKFRDKKNPFGVINVEFEVAWENSSAEGLMKHISTQKNNKYHISNGVDALVFDLADIDVCYALKMSHRYLKNNPFFLKTMRDIRYLESCGAKIPENLLEWFKFREKETYTYGHPKLNQDKKNFFNDDGVNYKYDHDTIHVAIKLYDKPAYEYFKADNEEVLCSKEKWDALPEELKLAAVFEESAVLSIERCLVPFDFSTPPKKAFLMALEKVSTSITSGWFREYAWNNYDRVAAMFSDDYVDKFKNALATGQIKPFTGKNY